MRKRIWSEYARASSSSARVPDVGLYESRRAGDRAVDVALRRQVHDGARLVLLQQAAHQRAVGDVALHEDVARIVAHRLELRRLPA